MALISKLVNWCVGETAITVLSYNLYLCWRRKVLAVRFHRGVVWVLIKFTVKTQKLGETIVP